MWPWAPPPRPSLWKEYGRHALLFVLTALSIYLMGGPFLALGLLSILLAHEMGHYVACRLYGVDATLPFFIPAPMLSFVGTLGAFIRIRSPIPNRRALFDIGVAGPLAGFLVCLPVLVLGTLEARLIPAPPADSRDYISFGNPLLIQWVFDWLRPDPTQGHTFLLGPLGLAAWFGLFVTALNLMPIGQLDGGHAMYALLRRRAWRISRIGSWLCVGLVFLSPTWILWAILVRVLGRRHPPTLDDAAPLGRERVWVGVLSLAVFVVCFVPTPIVVTWADFFEAVSPLLPRFLTGR